MMGRVTLFLAALVLLPASARARDERPQQPPRSQRLPSYRVRPEIDRAYLKNVVVGFLKSNEGQYENWRDSTAAGAGGGWIGTGTDGNFHLINLLAPRTPQARPFRYVVVDTDPRVREVNTVYMVLARLARRHAQPRAKFYSLLSCRGLPPQLVAGHEKLDAAGIARRFRGKPSRATLAGTLRELRQSGLASARELAWVERFLGESLGRPHPRGPRYADPDAEALRPLGLNPDAFVRTPFADHLVETSSSRRPEQLENQFGLLASDENFLRVVDLYEQGNLRFVTGSVTGSRTMKDIAADFKRSGIRFGGAYVSNIENYIESSKDKLLKNLLAFDGGAKATILRTGTVSKHPGLAPRFVKSESTVVDYARLLRESGPAGKLKYPLMDHYLARASSELVKLEEELRAITSVSVRFTPTSATHFLHQSYFDAARRRNYEAIKDAFRARLAREPSWLQDRAVAAHGILVDFSGWDLRLTTNDDHQRPLPGLAARTAPGSRGDFYLEHIH